MSNFVPNQAEVIISNIGSFWSNVFTDHDKLTTVINSSLELYAQTELDQLDLMASLSRFEIPIFKHKNWILLTPSDQDVQSANQRLYELGNDSIELGDPINLGDTKSLDNWELDISSTDIDSISYIVDSPSNPTVILSRNIDFYIDGERNKLVLLQNPVTTGFKTRTELVDGVQLTYYKLWLCNCDLDLQWVYKQFGYVLNLYTSNSSEAYKQLVNAVFDTLILGSNVLSFRYAIASLLGIKLVVDADETIEDIKRYSDYSLVITSSNVYSFDSTIGNLIDLAIGDIVHRGDILVDALSIYELSNYGVIADSAISAIFVEPESTKLGLTGSLSFSNQLLPTSYAVSDQGVVNVRFPLGGFANDIETFWTFVEAEGTTTGRTVAKAIGLTGTTGEPIEASIPVTINPMVFLINNVYKSNTMIIRMVIADSLISSINDLSILRKLVPAHISVIFVIEITQDAEEVELPTEPSDPSTFKVVDQSDTESYNYSSIIESCQLSYVES